MHYLNLLGSFVQEILRVLAKVDIAQTSTDSGTQFRFINVMIPFNFT